MVYLVQNYLVKQQ